MISVNGFERFQFDLYRRQVTHRHTVESDLHLAQRRKPRSRFRLRRLAVHDSGLRDRHFLPVFLHQISFDHLDLGQVAIVIALELLQLRQAFFSDTPLPHLYCLHARPVGVKVIRTRKLFDRQPNAWQGGGIASELFRTVYLRGRTFHGRSFLPRNGERENRKQQYSRDPRNKMLRTDRSIGE